MLYFKEQSFYKGTGPRVPFANGLGQLEKAVSGKLGSEVNYAVSAINYGYADSGLFGAFVIADAGAAGKVFCQPKVSFLPLIREIP